MEPYYTLIIPTYNSEPYIRRCIDSILAQSFCNFEILIIDGLSNDNTLNVIKSYNDARINVYSERDNGAYDAMNKGIEFAKGTWLYFLGSDDNIYDDNVLSNLYQELKNTKSKVIYGNVKISGDTDWAKDGEIYAGEFNIDKILKQNICHQAIFYHKSVFEKCGKYNVNYNICADWDLNLKCFSYFEPKHIDMIIAMFYGGNTSSNNSKDHLFGKDKWKNTIKYFNFKILLDNSFYVYWKHILRAIYINIVR
jgi:glycosyltransferase involved in cell wall biosynthesis